MDEKNIKIYGNARLKIRSDTLENWQRENPVLLAGEPAIVTDGGESEKIKFGDGINTFNDLPYWKGPKGEKGNDYVLSEQDKKDIAFFVLEKFIDVSEVGL